MMRKVFDPTREAWIRWVNAYCPLNGLCYGPRDLVHLCQVPDREIAAIGAKGWVEHTLAEKRHSGSVRVDAAFRVARQVAEILEKVDEERKVSRAR